MTDQPEIWCYAVDRGRWGQFLAKAAANRGWESNLFLDNDDYNRFIRAEHYAFMRIPQWEPELTKGKQVARNLIFQGCNLIPDFETLMFYEDKIAQAYAYPKWMPQTEIVLDTHTEEYAEAAAVRLGFPFLSKAKQGSASKNVRVINNLDEAMEEYRLVMHADGIPIAIGKGRTGRQTGYLLWQKFVPNNPCDYRVVITGKHMMMLERTNAPGTVFASGSGIHRPVNDPTEFQMGALDKAREFFERHNIKWCGIDLVHDEDRGWLVLETTLGWSLAAYADCLYHGTDYTGKNMFNLLLDQIEEGVFG